TYLIAPIVDDTPVTKIAATTSVWPSPGMPTLVERGGYVVQPAPAEPRSVRKEARTRSCEMRKAQNEYMFSFGNAMSRAPIISGMRKLPKQPERTGVTAQEISTRPGA